MDAFFHDDSALGRELVKMSVGCYVIGVHVFELTQSRKSNDS